MSGIAGIVRFVGAPLDPQHIHTMTDAMVHRGPDGITHWQQGSVALGQCMLHTTPESLTEHQPLLSNDGALVLVMDGRVDNWETLRKNLKSKAIVLRDNSDAELVLQAYILWGEDCLAHIEGDYALAIWNGETKKLFCARDPLGNKTFTYYWNGKTFYFASELHAMLALPEVPQELNEGILAEFLSDQFYSMEETFWQNIMRLPAAHLATIDRKGLQARRYWTPDLWATLSYTRDEDFIAHYREVFSDTVRRLSRSHKPLSAHCSGGLDSSAIFAMVEHLSRQHQLLAPEINGYTLDFSFDPDANESVYSRAVGEHLDKLIEAITPASPTITWYQQNAKKYRDFPPYPNGAMGISIYEKVRTNGGRVLLHGVGGDEWLGSGRVYYAEELAALQFRQIAEKLKQDANNRGWPTAVWWLMRYGLVMFLPERIMKQVRHIKHHQQYCPPQWLSSDLQKALKGQQKKQFEWPKLKLRWPGQRAELNILTRPYYSFAQELQERLSASYQLEYRSPYRTREMVQLSFMMPKRLLRAHGFNRYAHRKAMSGLLPECVARRQTKAEFSVTYVKVMQQIETEWEAIRPRCAKWLQPGCKDSLIQAHSFEKNLLWEFFGCDSVLADYDKEINLKGNNGGRAQNRRPNRNSPG